MDISPRIQNQLVQYQNLQQQLQMVMGQRIQAETRLTEVSKSLEALSNLKEGAAVYRSVGSLLLQTNDREAMVKELSEQKEILEVNLGKYKRQEEELAARFDELQKKLKSEMEGLDATG